MGARDFIKEIAPYIVEEASKRGYKFPSAIIAQACLESGYGDSKLAAKYFNYFGMKCGSAWKGDSVNLSTKEEVKGGLVTIKDNFRVYKTTEEGVKGYFDFISTPRYNALKNAVSARDYLQKIKSAGYATSSVYVDSCMKIVTVYDLTKYDEYGTKTPYEAEKEASKKSNETIAREVIQGKWGNGSDRKTRLTKAGYDYRVVQDIVNEMYRKNMV